MFAQFVLGAIQGIAEWLPVSSEGLIILVRTNIFPVEQSVADAIREALFLHMGTFFAALVYFRRDVARLLRAPFKGQGAMPGTKPLFLFLAISTLLSGAIGFSIAEGEQHAIAPAIGEYAGWINIGIGLMLVITGGLLLVAHRSAGIKRETRHLNWVDGVLLGVVQGFAAVPGLSRSGLTVSALLLRRVREEDALRISFLMSLPIVFAANIVFNLPLLFDIDAAHLVGLAASFVFGLLTIHILLRVAKRINFGKFVLAFGVLLLLVGVL